MTQEPWVMPEWMKPYEDLIVGHGGNGVTDLMNRLRTQANLAFTNNIVFTMACEISAQVGMLHRLRDAGFLSERETAQDAEAYFTMADAAQFKGVSYHTVSRAVRRHRLAHHRIGRQVLITSADLDAWRPMVERRPKRYARRSPDTNVTPTVTGAVTS